MPLSWNEIKSRALTFSRTWADAANEDSQGKPFWIDFFEIFGITDKRVATFEHAVKKLPGLKAKTDGFVDLFWPGMLLVEQKSRGKNLDVALTQAMSYFPGIAERDLPQLVIVCDFARFRVHRLTTNETFEFALKDLHKHIKLFGFVAGYKVQTIQPQNPVNIKAAERMGRLHDALKASGYSGHPLEVLLVRLLFCLFADDTGIFQPAQSFRTFIEERTAADGSDLGSRLAQLFQVLNTDEPKRSQALDEQVAAFPYVNGKLFSEPLPMADFTAAMREALLDACALDWSSISPAIFGSLFQSIMDDKARRNLGAHYTSEENILKLIKPLFLDDLWAEFAKVKNNKNRLFEFHKKLRTLTFFDPACGCGNFLVISYRELRELELAVLRASITDGQQTLDIHGLIGINVDQFHGIEIEEFPAQIAQVALWLMDHQMNLRVSEEFGLYFARIPLRTSPHIVHDNALRLDWNEVIPAERCSFVLGNPPFVGAKFMDDAQREDTRLVFAGVENAGLLDFVAAWYVKAAHYMRTVRPDSVRPELVEGTPASAVWPAGAHEPSVFKIAPTGHTALTSGYERANTRCAFVSTNSVTQGEQVGVLWGWLLAQGVHIHFAHRTFSWSNEASGKAAVHCVIIGFGLQDLPGKVIFEYDDIRGEPHAVAANNINPYLVDAPDVVLPRRSKPICDVPEIGIGNKPIDDGNYLFTTEEKLAFIAEEPASEKWFRRWLGADEFLNGYERWCLWLGDCPPGELRTMPLTMKRVQAVKAFRLASKSTPTQKLALTPTRFHVENIPSTPYLLIPRVSSERRVFVPMGYIDAGTLTSDSAHMATSISLFHFGVLSSTMHNAWMRTTCGRLKSDYRYSKDIVYNNFPWPEFASVAKTIEPLTPHHPAKTAIETAAQTVLDVRAKFQTGKQPATLADLYDPLTMPPELLKAHQKLDAAVDKAYEASGGKKHYKSDAERVAFLFELYQKYTSLLPSEKPKSKRKARLV
ncbi:DNA methyltransferase [Rhodoferax sp.]|uniref:DNA methyltransferase n=1 Tax=Rhodoferax sp. TaxID=50421 RepID=UPI00272EE99A|nr:DNA methyltransferase [Rhodoferax sp.]MDP2440245.1 class I SAM-dependent DNA methyltransferase [Rhodoferax sp.]MDZ4208767.1 DNA methyltransferase [Rhodoferax sp.]